jgi:hypothetical protein
MIRRRGLVGNSDALISRRGKIHEIPIRGPRGLFREWGSPVRE